MTLFSIASDIITKKQANQFNYWNSWRAFWWCWCSIEA